jgi:hypothetical protein
MAFCGIARGSGALGESDEAGGGQESGKRWSVVTVCEGR